MEIEKEFRDMVVKRFQEEMAAKPDVRNRFEAAIGIEFSNVVFSKPNSKDEDGYVNEELSVFLISPKKGPKYRNGIYMVLDVLSKSDESKPLEDVNRFRSIQW